MAAACSSSFICNLHTKSQTDRDNKEMHIPGLAPDFYSFMKFAFTIFFITLGFIFIMQCQCTDFVHEEEDDFFDADGYFDVRRRNLNYRDRDRDRDSDSNTDTTDTDRYTDTDTDTDRDYYYYPIGPIPSAPPVRDYCLVCGDWSTIICIRCKVARYCSEACRTKHWREDHWLVCKEYKSPGKRKKSGKEHRSVVKCPICLKAIGTYKHSRSSLSCGICNQKFHSHCISKWFSTSMNSTCPCCKSPFQPAGSATGESSSSSR